MKLDKNEIVFASMSPKEALEFTGGYDKEKIKFLRDVKAKAQKIDEQKQMIKVARQPNYNGKLFQKLVKEDEKKYQDSLKIKPKILENNINKKVSKPNDMLKYIEHSVYAYGDGPKPKNFDEKYLDKLLNNKLAMSETPEEEAEMLLGGEALEFMKWLKDHPDSTYNDWLKDKTAFSKDAFKLAAASDKQQEEAEKLIEIEKKKMQLDPLYIPEIIDPEEVKKEESMQDFMNRRVAELKEKEVKNSGITKII